MFQLRHQLHNLLHGHKNANTLTYTYIGRGMREFPLKCFNRLYVDSAAVISQM